ncbi:hypothetical protein ACFQY5_26685 [Paeniroseomonas aquatica]|uniref:hypothetical protein n=1 Tax=Paeniroseomonas aquatica TaxID=373043 RepID=UPI00360B0DEE
MAVPAASSARFRGGWDMADYDLVVRGGTVASGLGTMRCDIGIRGGRIVALAESIPGGAATLDAGGLLVLPGGVDTHCHIEEPSRGGYTSAGGAPATEVTVQEESFGSASVSAFAGGTTSVVCFVPQWKGEGILPRLADYEARAARGMVDYSFHQIISDATDDVLEREVPEVVARGIRSLKVFLTYEPLHLSDEAFLKVLVTARRHGCLVTVHCENTPRSIGGPRPCSRRASPRRNTMPGRARPWWSGRRRTAPSRSPSWWTSRSRSST